MVVEEKIAMIVLMVYSTTKQLILPQSSLFYHKAQSENWLLNSEKWNKKASSAFIT